MAYQAVSGADAYHTGRQDTKPSMVTISSFDSTDEEGLSKMTNIMGEQQNPKHEDVQSPSPQTNTKSEGPAMRRRASTFTRHILSWAPEAVWCFVALALLVALVVLLSQYNNQPLPDWPLGLTLNTAVALIATALRAVTVVVISEAISQLKWNRFVSQTRRLSDLHVFDQASRGPWGSLLMVARGRGGVLSTAAALVFVTGLATSTITQSAISYSTRLVASLDSRASILIRTTYGESGPGNEPERSISSTPNGIENVAFQAVYQPADQSWPMTEPTCSSGDCRWKTFDSLALCYDMQNVTDKLTITTKDGAAVSVEQNATLTLPIQGDFYLADVWSITSGIQQYNILNLTSPWPNLGNSATFMETDLNSFPRFRESIAHANDSDVLRATTSQWFAIYNNANADKNDEDHKYRAVELLWHFCVKTYNVSVEGGTPKTNVVATSTKVREGQGYGFDRPLNEDTDLRNFTLVSENGQSKFSVFDTFDYRRLDIHLRSAFEGGYSTMWTDEAPFNEFSRGISQKMFDGINVNTTVADADKQVWDNLENLAAAVSDATTDFMRKKGTTEEGETLIPETFVQVRWAWLSFVAIQVGLSVLFLVSIVWHTASLGVDVVKSSNMSELFALRHDTRYSQLPSEAIGIHPLVDPSIVAKLEKSDGTWSLEVSRQPVSLVRGMTTSLRR